MRLDLTEARVQVSVVTFFSDISNITFTKLLQCNLYYVFTVIVYIILGQLQYYCSLTFLH